VYRGPRRRPCRSYRWTLVAQLASWFNAYCLVRTVSSSLEALAAVAALYHLEVFRQISDAKVARQHVTIAATAAALGVVIRPPSLLFWALPGTSHLLPRKCLCSHRCSLHAHAVVVYSLHCWLCRHSGGVPCEASARIPTAVQHHCRQRGAGNVVHCRQGVLWQVRTLVTRCRL
jgi:Alg9-like mannosyltransferase family